MSSAGMFYRQRNFASVHCIVLHLCLFPLSHLTFSFRFSESYCWKVEEMIGLPLVSEMSLNPAVAEFSPSHCSNVDELQ